MLIKFPDFRNLMTTGNVISACAACFVAGMAWSDVNRKLESHEQRFTKLEAGESSASADIQKLEKVTIKLDGSVQYLASQMVDMKKWLEKISDQVSAKGR